MSSLRDIWFIHGFGGSGQIFNEAFSSPLTKNHDLYVPDIPGFGVTPPVPGLEGIQGLTSLLGDLIRDVSGDRPIVVVAHSLGGVIGTWLCERFIDKVAKYINVEGNLTEADAYFCGLANDFDSVSGFQRAYEKKVFAMLGDSEAAINRHYASMCSADPRAMLMLGKSGAAATGEAKSGEEFVALNCDKRYYWSEKSTPRQTKTFIEKKNLPDRRFNDCGHWPMIEKAEEFYRAILNDL
jgi:pimeloyl-ACP methyl ester carboxylesterase